VQHVAIITMADKLEGCILCCMWSISRCLEWPPTHISRSCQYSGVCIV